MATKMRLVDANASLAEVVKAQALEPDKAIAKIITLLTEAESVDAVEVVRCKDCKHWKYDAKKLCGFCDALICYRPDYFWCMYGERKDNG